MTTIRTLNERCVHSHTRKSNSPTTIPTEYSVIFSAKTGALYSNHIHNFRSEVGNFCTIWWNRDEICQFFTELVFFRFYNFFFFLWSKIISLNGKIYVQIRWTILPEWKRYMKCENEISIAILRKRNHANTTCSLSDHQTVTNMYAVLSLFLRLYPFRFVFYSFVGRSLLCVPIRTINVTALWVCATVHRFTLCIVWLCGTRLHHTFWHIYTIQYIQRKGKQMCRFPSHANKRTKILTHSGLCVNKLVLSRKCSFWFSSFKSTEKKTNKLKHQHDFTFRYIFYFLFSIKFCV